MLRRLRQGNAVTAALLELFRAFAAQDVERGRAEGRRAIVDPTLLRKALAAYNAAAFRIGVPLSILANFSWEFSNLSCSALWLDRLLRVEPHSAAV